MTATVKKLITIFAAALACCALVAFVAGGVTLGVVLLVLGCGLFAYATAPDEHSGQLPH